MNTQLFRRAEELFHRLVELEPEARSTLLARECGSDAELRHELELLLASDREAEPEFLAGARPPYTPLPLEPGDRLGPYTILARLGEGGMGLVYRARQDIPAREVALKVIRPDRLTDSAARRFRHEAEILGSLQHPGIAQVFEGGTALVEDAHGGKHEQAYLAMELVRGKNILAHAEERKLDTRARIELFARVADALHHAHLRGVIHRDLKAANVLVADEETGSRTEIGQPKVLDFGIARGRGPEGAELRETRAGDFLGTLSCSSPEQLAGPADAIDLRADVWALGALLFELLTGARPFALEELPLAEAVRRVTTGTARRLEDFRPELGGDLAVIVARALDREPARRYQSAGELADDLRRTLAGEPIHARADSALYVLQRRLERHRVTLAGALVACVAIGVLALVLAREVRRNGELARREANARAHAEAELITSNLERGRLHARAGHPLAEELLWREFLRDPDSEAAYWALWEQAAASPRLAAVDTASRPVRAVAFARDDSWVASGAEDGTLAFFDARDLTPLVRLALGSGIFDLAVSADGTLLAACADGSVRVIDAMRGVAAELGGHAGEVHAVAEHPREGWILSTGADGTMRRHERSGGEGRVLLRARSAGWGCAFAPDGAHFAVACSEGAWLAASDGSAPRLLASSEATFAVTFAPDGRTLFTGARDRMLRAFDVASAAPVAERALGAGQLYRLWIGADGILNALGDWRIERLELPALTPLAPLGDPRVFWGGASSVDGLRLASATESELFLWDVDPRAGQRSFAGHAGRVSAVLSPDGTRLASGDSRGTVRVWDSAEGRELARWDEQKERVRALAFGPRGEWLASGSSDGSLVVRALPAGPMRVLASDFVDVTRASLAVSPDGERLVAGCEGPCFRVLRVADGALVRELPCAGVAPLGACFAPDGTFATLARKPGGLELWSADLAPLGLLTPAELGASPWTMAFSPDGKRLAIGTWSMTIQVWDVATLTLEFELEGHLGAVWDVAFVPERPELLVSAGADGTVRLWSLTRASNLATIEAFASDAITVSALRAGPTIVTAGADARVRSWDLGYFERYLAGNLAYELARFRPEFGAELDEVRLRERFARSR
jgi:WD40 repeat protein/serine/threonine protein kinase